MYLKLQKRLQKTATKPSLKRLSTLKNKRHRNAKSKLDLAFVAKVDEENNCAFNVNFLKKKAGLYKLFFPEMTDRSFVSIIDVLAKLPLPIEAGSTSRTAAMYTFKFDFSKFTLGQ